ncbi:hypothetical protein AVEN_129130-1 [Araneus ventricosus]|uniref:Uncharacterized protein n=1 Tax=Araneus ventricosus TaxID=182803 RepID=A0A4Y2RYS0_ARAVE|nr:hypothetical protein AVEN_129130-1 [Araneus ventricosus]
MARRDVELSDSFIGHFEMQETSFCNGTPKEGPSQTEVPEDSSSPAHTIDDPCFADVSTFRYSACGRLPRHSISDGLSPDTPLLPQRRPLELSRLSWMKNGTDSKRLQNGGTVSNKNKYPPNYSTFENGCETSDTEPLLAKPTFENGCDAPETEPLMAKSTFENGFYAPETEPLPAKKS